MQPAMRSDRAQIRALADYLCEHWNPDAQGGDCGGADTAQTCIAVMERARSTRQARRCLDAEARVAECEDALRLAADFIAYHCRSETCDPSGTLAALDAALQPRRGRRSRAMSKPKRAEAPWR